MAGRSKVAALRDVTLPGESAERTPASPEVRAKVEEVWTTDALVTRLFKIAYAICRSKSEAKELMQEASLRVLEGRRRWDLAKSPDAVVYLGNVVGSLWTHIQAQARLRERAEPLTQPVPNPERAVIEKEEALENAAIQEELAAELDAPDRAHSLMDLYRDGIFDAAEQQARLGVTSDELQVLKKRLKRALMRVVERRRKRRRP